MSASEEQANAVRLENISRCNPIWRSTLSELKAKSPRSIEQYLTLPFELSVSDTIPIVELQLMSDVEAKTFRDVRIATKKEGECYRVTFRSAYNNGPELVACLLNKIGSTAPRWLEVEGDECEFNHELSLKVSIESDTISFNSLSDDEQDPDSECFIDLDCISFYCGESLFYYLLDDASPDFVILDAFGSRVAVSLDGYVLDEFGEETEERLFVPEELENKTELQTHQDISYEQQQKAWMTALLHDTFPGDTHLSFRPLV